MGYLAATADPTTGYNLVTGLGSVNVNNLATSVGSTAHTQHDLSFSLRHSYHFRSQRKL